MGGEFFCDGFCGEKSAVEVECEDDFVSGSHDLYIRFLITPLSHSGSNIGLTILMTTGDVEV